MNLDNLEALPPTCHAGSSPSAFTAPLQSLENGVKVGLKPKPQLIAVIFDKEQGERGEVKLIQVTSPFGVHAPLNQCT